MDSEAYVFPGGTDPEAWADHFVSSVDGMPPVFFTRAYASAWFGGAIAAARLAESAENTRLLVMLKRSSVMAIISCALLAFALGFVLAFILAAG